MSHLVDDLLDAIAAERNAADNRSAAALEKMQAHLLNNEHSEAGRCSTEAERHATAAVSLRVVLEQCQRLADAAEGITKRKWRARLPAPEQASREQSHQ